MENRQLSIFEESGHRRSFLQPNPEGCSSIFPAALLFPTAKTAKRYLVISDPFSEFIIKTSFPILQSQAHSPS